MISTKIRVLVVDDMMTMRKLIILACKKLGFTDFLEAKDGAEAYQVLAAASPPVGLILSDITMPGSNGMDFLKRVRAEARFKHLPVIMITAEAENHYVVAALKAGATSYIVKPVNAEIIKMKIEELPEAA
jgi:two-component system chemotaxis response regulator CheY